MLRDFDVSLPGSPHTTACVALAAIGIACAAATPPPPAANPASTARAAEAAPTVAAPQLNPSGLVRVEGLREGVLYIKRDHHIASYDGFLIEPIHITYRRGQRPLSEHRLATLTGEIRRDVERSVLAGGLEVMTQAHECALTMSVQIRELQLLDLEPASGSATRFMTSSGSALFYFEYRDSLSGEVLLQYGQRRLLPGGRVFSAGSLSAQGLAEGFRETLAGMSDAMGKFVPLTTKVREGIECRGKLGMQGANSRTPEQ